MEYMPTQDGDIFSRHEALLNDDDIYGAEGGPILDDKTVVLSAVQFTQIRRWVLFRVDNVPLLDEYYSKYRNDVELSTHARGKSTMTEVEIQTQFIGWLYNKEEFYFNIPEEEARAPMQVEFSKTWRTHKSRLRRGFIRRAGNVETALSIAPPKVDPIHWRAFVRDEFKPETIARNKQNAKNRSKNKYSHTMGQCSYARKQNEMVKAKPEKRHTPDEICVAAHVRPDGTILPSATEAYEKLRLCKQNDNQVEMLRMFPLSMMS